MKILFLADKTRHDQPVLFGNLASAAQQCGDTTVLSLRQVDPKDAQVSYDAVCCWGWRRAKRYYDLGMNVLVAERGYVGDRFKWYSLGWNGLNGRAQFPTGCASRWEKLGITMQSYPITLHGYAAYALVLGQVPSDTAVRGINFLSWARTAVEAMRSRGFKTHYRAHPKAPQSRPVGVSLLGGDLNTALRGATVAVTYNSNSGVDAALAGVPVIACDPGSMAYAVSGHGLKSKIVTPDRDEWAHRLAWAQWLIEEAALQSTWLKLKTALLTEKG